MYIYTHTYVYTIYIHTYVCGLISAREADMRPGVVHIYLYICKYTHTHMYIYTYVYIYYIHTHICIYTIYTHTHVAVYTIITIITIYTIYTIYAISMYIYLYYIYCVLRDNFVFKFVPMLNPDCIPPPLHIYIYIYIYIYIFPPLFVRLLTYADVCYILYSQRQLRVQSGAHAQPRWRH
jgi:hypothetical protein